MILLFIILATLLFTLLAWKKFDWALGVFFALLPTYLIRFYIGTLPSTFLEVMIWVIIIVSIIRYRKKMWQMLHALYKHVPGLFIATMIFLIAATIDVFVASNIRQALGEWKAFYVEPIILFLVLTSILLTEKKKAHNYVRAMLIGLILCGFVTSLLAIYQHFTGWLVPYSFWQNRDTYRVTGWYGFPNAVSLFLAPLTPLSIYLATLLHKEKKQNWIFKRMFWIAVIFPITGVLAIAAAESTGGLIGVAMGFGILLLYYKKTRWWAVGIGITAIISVFLLPTTNGIRKEILAQNKSGQIRIAMWHEAGQYLQNHPVVGTGMASYDTRIRPYHRTVNGQGVEIFHHPHNIFLTIWVNTGLLGLIGFICILIWYFRTGIYIIVKYKHTWSGALFFISSMTVVVTTGLVDSPYIKNDLAVFFWMLPMLLIVALVNKGNV